jgi:cell division control protein 6
MEKSDFERITAELEEENKLFADKSYLESLKPPSRLVGRQDKAKELARFLFGYKKGHVVPFISVYGPSGSGKSTIVGHVLENLDPENIKYKYVNLRKAKTVFGCANLILNEFGLTSLKSAQGINIAIDQIAQAIKLSFSSNSDSSKHKLFVLVLDEFDVLFQDKRTSPSDFMYKLLAMQEKLRQQDDGGRSLVCLIAISNNVTSDYKVDERVRSRIGSASEVFFGPYNRNEVLEILKDRAEKAFVGGADSAVLEYCAEQSSLEHGDARRAIDLLRVAAEIAGRKGETKLLKDHIDMAATELQKDRIATVLANASLHLKLVISALARLAYLKTDARHSTTAIYDQYCKLVQEGVKPLTSRRVAELLTELENTGLVISETISMGRHGYGNQYRLTVSPEAVGNVCFPDWWKGVMNQKERDEKVEKLTKDLSSLTRFR